MQLTVFHHRILAGVIVMLLAVLIPLGRTLEKLLGSFLSISPQVISLCSLVVATSLFIYSGLKFYARNRTDLVQFVLLSVLVGLCVTVVRTSAEWCHVVVYGGLGFSLFNSNLFQWRRISPVLMGVLLGCADEFAQSYYPGRVGDPSDVGLDLIGLVAGVWLAQLLARHDERVVLRTAAPNRKSALRPQMQSDFSITGEVPRL